MICQLKRFCHDTSKINDPVGVDNHLLLDDSEKSQYDLMGAVLYIRASRSTRHYETVVKCPNGSWVKFSDKRVSRMDHLPLLLLRTSANVLFFAKTDRQKLEVAVVSPGEPSHIVVRAIPNGQEKIRQPLVDRIASNFRRFQPIHWETIDLW
ncbi:putative ubiquitin carboxyl-terminal hydrolase 16 [Frankliniella fusca]|uniref:Ubiquitin carboxyl-terminal hydrolase 16 n=1 Tax=Frankliniella fusca TaxID=407009 RepID=A0AAE1GRF6_9NEOP|nr:putative ubiquitin carboxyl-terminal hydrolase 16 [Frankliniella fusca]